MRVKVTVKVKAVTPNSQILIGFLHAFRNWTQYVVNEIWNLNHIPSMRELHRKFYRVLREQGFRAHHCHKIERRARNILLDSCHCISRRIVEIAKEYNALIVLEDLNKLRSRVNGSKRFNKKLSLWTYRRIQSYIRYKALIEGLPVVYTDPRGTSKKSPIGGELEFINYRWAKLPNGVITTRDIIASWNLALRGLKLLTQDVGHRGSVDALKAPDQMQTQEGMRGKHVHGIFIILITMHGQPHAKNH